MIADLPSCEWHPGSNRATVNPVVAVARLDMPAPTRAALIAKMERHQFDDVVSITWAAVTSKQGANDYSADIRRMNFGEGRICERVTRAKWDSLHSEEAIVYIVDGRAYGVAAACGNLFEMSRTDHAAPLTPIAAPTYMDGSDLRTGGPIGFAYATPIPLAMVPAGAVGGYGGGSWGAAAGFGGGGGYVQQTVLCDCVPTPPCPVAAVPEPSTLALIVGGIAAVFARTRPTRIARDERMT